jgi:hypothetical protein
MLQKNLSLIVLVFLSLALPLQSANYAHAIIDYHPGAGFATEFGTGLGFTVPESALGEPSRLTVNPHPVFGGTFAVDPFNPPYLRDQLVSIGEGGRLTVRFENPIWNDPANPFGLDFIIFGNAGFIISNGDFSGGGITDGSLFSANSGATRVSVSADNVTYFQLDPARAPLVDSLFPTDGSGDFSIPVNPALTGLDFAGLDLAGIRSHYQGSGGGAGFDLSWARDENGAAVDLPSIRFIRVDVLSGAAEIDGFAAVRGSIGGETIREEFSTDPVTRGWDRLGDASLFNWDSERKSLQVVWDSSKPNSSFFRQLPRALGKQDTFTLELDLVLDQITPGVQPEKPFAFQIAFGFFNQADLLSPSFVRGTGSQSPNLVEFNYFPDTGFGATVSPVIVSSGSQFAPAFSFPLELTTGDLFQVEMHYNGEERRLTTSMTRNGEFFGPIKEVQLGDTFTDFQVDAVGISSYSDAGATSSILAQGEIRNLRVTLPPHPVRQLTGRFSEHSWETEFASLKGWNYFLERSRDLEIWVEVASEFAAADGGLILRDDEPLAGPAFYRVKASR